MWYLVTIEVTFWLPLCPQFEGAKGAAEAAFAKAGDERKA
jgi:hypothetical protein